MTPHSTFHTPHSALGVMGGTFDPIHWAHLVMAEESKRRFELDKVLFIPAGEPPHKATYPVTSAEHRYAMTLLATAENPAFEVSRIEIERNGPSYSVDTIRQLKIEYGPDTGIYFIAGADEALDILTWHEAESLPELARFIVAPRPGFRLADLQERLPERFRAAMVELSMPPIDISSTELRARVAEGKSITYLVPDAVEAYIRKHKLYAHGKTT